MASRTTLADFAVGHVKAIGADAVFVDLGGAEAGARGEAIVFGFVRGKTREGGGESGGAAVRSGEGDEDAAIVINDIDESAAGVAEDGEAEGDGFVEDAACAV